MNTITNYAIMDREVQMTDKEQRKRVTASITEKVKYILSHTADDGIGWGGSKADLLELLHDVYVHGTIIMPDGRPATMVYLVNTCFATLGLTVMKSYRMCTQRAEARKGIRGGCLARRMQQLMTTYGDDGLCRFWNTLIINP